MGVGVRSCVRKSTCTCTQNSFIIFVTTTVLLKRLDFKAIRFHLPGGSTDRSLGDGGGGGGRVGGGGVGGCGGGGRGCCKGALGTSPPPPTPPPPSRSSLPPISPKSLFCQTTNPPAHNAASSTSCRRSERLISILLSYRDRCGYVYNGTRCTSVQQGARSARTSIPKKLQGDCN